MKAKGMEREGKASWHVVTALLVGLTLAACDDDVTRVGPLDEPEWTVMVYMAGDNTLSTFGIQNIDDMEEAGVDPRVQVVVQAEFSPAALAEAECDASCFNRPNFNTFRYVITGEGEAVPGPDGSTIDLGNRNMTDPAELNEFVQWAQTNYPARKSLLVLWNHGGGYAGLLEDDTSAGKDEVMQLSELPNALAGADIDVLGFDMCLMAGYETLANITGQAPFTVFSEETVPAAGYPYTPIIAALHDAPAMDGRTAAENIVELYHASYMGAESPTTMSAYDLAGFSDFESALDSLAGSLQSNLPELAPAIASAAAASQQFDLGAALLGRRERDGAESSHAWWG